MSVFFEKGRGWKFDFTLQGKRYTGKYCKTKTAAKKEEAEKREEILNPAEAMTTDMTFRELINQRLDHVKAYNSKGHYEQYRFKARMWLKQWPDMRCHQITQRRVEIFLLKRRDVSSVIANIDLRYLRALFNFGIKKKLIQSNPTDGIEFFPVEEKVKYVPMPDDIELVIELADCDTQDYLWVMRETLGRMGEVNQLTWDDIDLRDRYVILYTRKKKGGHRKPRRIPMTVKLFDVLSKRYEKRDLSKPWVFWHECISSKTRESYVGPYQDRKKFMKTLCREAGVKYFRFHALRHAGASIMDNNNVPLGAIQEILGHENRSTTEIYVHSVSGAAHQAMATYERARQNSHSNPHS